MTAKLFAAEAVQTLPDFERNAVAIADALRERGVSDGTRVMLKAGNSAGYVGALLALMHVGASIVMVDHQERAEATQRICDQAGVKISVVDDDTPVLEGGPVRVTIYELLVAALEQSPAEQRLSFDTWCALPDGLIMWSSGSTGEPKGVVKTGAKFLKNLERNARQVGHRPDDVLLPLLPFSHQYGLSMVLIAWLVKCSLVIAPYRRLDRAMTMAGACGATVVDATPASYRSMLNMIGRKPALADQLSGVRMFCSGAAPLDPGLVGDYVNRFGLPLLDSYGSTEAGNVSFATEDNAVACGRAVEGLELRIVDDEGTVLPSGEVGEIQVHSPDLMEGYLGDDGTVTPVDANKVDWYPTGDFGYLDGGENLFVLGRKSAVHRNGHTLYPEIIEHKLAAGGCLTKVVPVPDQQRGCQLVFFVEDEQRREPRFWREPIASLLPAFEHPNRIHVVERFPLNRNGKPDKRELERLAMDLAPGAKA
ncbi:class I adenylate-forming enzyme family protein [Streptomyces hygroscopicus]|uniref:class I adenylate-forming enzyme family protein n=1 Tax=Streptomyces hygroscopicus TaxID=1912 RepID=UPI0007811160|nr:class I adenylate-forming enzyme family protein [Streptomyces hygroscopicus]